MKLHLTKKSGNAKTGPIPVSTTSDDTCPNVCPFKGSGCYASYGPLGLHWSALNAGERGYDSIDAFCDDIAKLPAGQLWRHNQAGDLPGKGNRINGADLRKLVIANAGRKGYTYTHKPTTPTNIALIRASNAAGFAINLSANNLTHADTLASDWPDLPVVTVLPSDTVAKSTRTPAGRKIVTCPAVLSDTVTCASCGLCAINKAGRAIIGFPAHGAGKGKVDVIVG